MSAIPKRVRDAVAERSQGVCEVCSSRRAVHMHHRRLRSQGGRHEAVNLLHVDDGCHSFIHLNPERSYALGHLVRSCFDPAEVPIVRTVTE